MKRLFLSLLTVMVCLSAILVFSPLASAHTATSTESASCVLYANNVASVGSIGYVQIQIYYNSCQPALTDIVISAWSPSSTAHLNHLRLYNTSGLVAGDFGASQLIGNNNIYGQAV